MDEQQEIVEPLSKTRKKQLAKEIEQMASQLTVLPEKQLRQLTLSAELADEVELARSTKGRGSQKRQVKHLAAALRKRDDELQALLGQLQSLDQVGRSEKKEFHRLEKLRDRLCDKNSLEDAFKEMLNLCPDIDHKTISRLIRSVHEHNDRRAFREIFKRLRDCSGC
ncbi:MAG: hypothetical protein BA864_09320 [Desulfuromonadales bacterium C00003093]|nr:MAG: hypothetical protein BA864_09320 [Desulfuromonadales bacterium C00003093]